ncbi:hypothetical protein ACFL6Y_04490 [Elusimicrobiota bacterium]
MLAEDFYDPKVSAYSYEIIYLGRPAQEPIRTFQARKYLNRKKAKKRMEKTMKGLRSAGVKIKDYGLIERQDYYSFYVKYASERTAERIRSLRTYPGYKIAQKRKHEHEEKLRRRGCSIILAESYVDPRVSEYIYEIAYLR